MKIDDVLEDCKRICSKNIADLPVSKDVVRLAHKISIQVSSNGKDFVTSTKVTEKEEQNEIIFNLLKNASNVMQPEVTVSKDEYLKNVNLIDPDTLTKYMSKTFSENVRVTMIFKSIQQTLIARVLHRLRDTLKEEGLLFRDVRGMWFIDINVTKNLIGQITGIQTIHKRNERMLSENKQGINDETLFKFAWELVCHYDIKTLEICKADVLLIDVIFNDEREKALFKEESDVLIQTFKNVMNNIDSCKDKSSKSKEPKKKIVASSFKCNFITFIFVLLFVIVFTCLIVFLNLIKK
jgi:hypothetical protein